jgi:flavin-dependent dehydrogenase
VETVAERYDLVVVGGGPAGLAASIGACLEGLKAVVLDAATPPIDKPCGEGLMPDGAEVLARLGVDVDGIETRPFLGVRYIDGPLVAEGAFPDRPGLGIRRTALHQTMAGRAETLGVELRWGTRATGLTADGFDTNHGTVRGRWLVAADGRTSRVRRWAGLDGRPPRRRRFGVRRHYEIEPWTDLVEVHWSEGCEAYCTPVGERMVGVAMLWSGGAARFDELLQRFPSLAERLRGAAVASKDRGAGPLAQRCRRVALDSLFFVGDASGYVDAITGEGMALALHQAEAVVAAITAGRPSVYTAAHRRIGRYPNAVTRLLLEVEHRPRLRRRVMRALAADEQLMSKFLALKMAAGGPRMLGRHGLLRLSAEALLGGA